MTIICMKFITGVGDCYNKVDSRSRTYYLQMGKIMENHQQLNGDRTTRMTRRFHDLQRNPANVLSLITCSSLLVI